MSQSGNTSASIIAKRDSSWRVVLSKGINVLTDDLRFYDDRGFFPLLEKNKLLDLDLYKDDRDYIDYYLECISIDGRFMLSVTYENKLFAVVLLGDKLDSEFYSKEETYFIFSLCETAGVALNFISEKEEMVNEISELKKDIVDFEYIESLGERFDSRDSLAGIKKIVVEVFEKYGIESYAVFVRGREENFFLAALDQKLEAYDDFPAALDENSKFITALGKSGNVISLDDFRHRGEVSEIFGEELTSRFRLFSVHPYIAGGRNIGFVIVFGLAEGVSLEEASAKIRKVSRFIFNSAYTVQDVDVERNKYTDNLEAIYKKMSIEISNAAALKIPFSLLLFTIKNFRRCYTLFGKETADSVLDDIEKRIVERLSDYDFSFRYARGSFLIALPGKDKRAALQLGGAIRNSVTQLPDMPLLMTFLAAQYPNDGGDIFSLLDILE
jgi:GGDEF domain-containing protein